MRNAAFRRDSRRRWRLIAVRASALPKQRCHTLKALRRTSRLLSRLSKNFKRRPGQTRSNHHTNQKTKVAVISKSSSKHGLRPRQGSHSIKSKELAVAIKESNRMVARRSGKAAIRRRRSILRCRGRATSRESPPMRKTIRIWTARATTR